MGGLFGKPVEPSSTALITAQQQAWQQKLVDAARQQIYSNPDAAVPNMYADLVANTTTPRRAIELGEEMITKLADMLDAMEEMHKLIVPPEHKDTFDRLATAVRQQRDTARRIVELRDERTKHQAALNKTEGELSVIGESEPSYVRL